MGRSRNPGQRRGKIRRRFSSSPSLTDSTDDKGSVRSGRFSGVTGKERPKRSSCRARSSRHFGRDERVEPADLTSRLQNALEATRPLRGRFVICQAGREPLRLRLVIGTARATSPACLKTSHARILRFVRDDQGSNSWPVLLRCRCQSRAPVQPFKTMRDRPSTETACFRTGRRSFQ